MWLKDPEESDLHQNHLQDHQNHPQDQQNQPQDHHQLALVVLLVLLVLEVVLV